MSATTFRTSHCTAVQIMLSAPSQQLQEYQWIEDPVTGDWRPVGDMQHPDPARHVNSVATPQATIVQHDHRDGDLV